jgi:C-terminal processing protease CtpA/Prc
LVRLEPIEGKPVAVAVGNLPGLELIKPGMELLEIDSTPVTTIIERDLDPYISSSTTQDRQLREMRMLLQGPPGSTARTRWRTLEGATVDVALIRNESQNRAAMPAQRHDLMEFKTLPGDIAYIALNDFSNAKIDRDFETKLPDLRSARAWIIDLRINGGGSSEIGYAILSHFINAPVEGSTWRTRQYNPTFQAWGREQTWYEGAPDLIKPAAGPRFDGPVYILTSPNTCSAAEDFLVPLKVAKRAILVGEPTCGSSGQPLAFTVYGASARVCTKWDRFPDGTEFVGVGILPDVPSSRTRQDVASGRDAVLDVAVAAALRTK